MAANVQTENGLKQDERSGAPGLASATATERAIVEICEDILQREGITPRDDFFDDLKANSLDLIRVFGRVNESFNLSLQASVLGSEPTIARLASCVDAQLHK